MAMARINNIVIQGFRAFGEKPQRLDFVGQLALITGSNSNGKTSLAEAIEFLLTGRTTRRDFIASAAKEFADSLRHAHLDATVPTVITAEIQTDKGTFLVRRLLVADYSARGDLCQSELTIDGSPAADLTSIGIGFSQPPLESPVLMQHTLRYVVSAKPQDRATYFRALLEVSDVEALRTAVKSANSYLEKSPSPLDALITGVSNNSIISLALLSLSGQALSIGTLEQCLIAAMRGVLPSDAEAFTSAVDGLKVLVRVLAERQERTFPLQVFSAERDLVSSQPAGNPVNLRIPVEGDHPFRSKATTDSV